MQEKGGGRGSQNSKQLLFMIKVQENKPERITENFYFFLVFENFLYMKYGLEKERKERSDCATEMKILWKKTE